jgi:hypothetical protein
MGLQTRAIRTSVSGTKFWIASLPSIVGNDLVPISWWIPISQMIVMSETIYRFGKELWQTMAESKLLDRFFQAAE